MPQNAENLSQAVRNFSDRISAPLGPSTAYYPQQTPQTSQGYTYDPNYRPDSQYPMQETSRSRYPSEYRTYDPRFPAPPVTDHPDTMRAPVHAPLDPRVAPQDGYAPRNISLPHPSYNHEHDHRPTPQYDRPSHMAPSSGSALSSHHRRQDRPAEKFNSRSHGSDYPRGPRSGSGGGGGGGGGGGAHSSSQLQNSRYGDAPSSRSYSELERRGKGNRREALPYATYFRHYTVKVPYMSLIDLKRMHTDLSTRTDMIGIKNTWNNTIPLLPQCNDFPQIPVNFSIPTNIDNSAVPLNWVIRQPPSMPPQGFRTQVRVLLIRGSPIDISAPKGGSVHSNNNITFMLLERSRDPKNPSLSCPGGVYDPIIDGIGQNTSLSDDSTTIGDAQLIRTAIRTVKQQLSLDLSQCSKWFRFMEVEYGRDSAHVNDRVVYLIPSVWNILPTDEEFPELWRAHRNLELNAEAITQMESLKSRMMDIHDIHSPQYVDVKAQLTAKESQLNQFTVSPSEVIPPKPLLLIHTNPSETNGRQATNYTLQNLLQLDLRSSSTASDDMIELFLFGHRFDEYLQCFFGTSILTHIAIMRDQVLRGQRPILLEDVELVINPSNSNRKKRSRDQIMPSEVAYPNQFDQSDPLEPTVKVKREIKHEITELDDNPPFIPPPETFNPPVSPDANHLSLHPEAPVDMATSGVPLDETRSRPPLKPEHRDYRLMQAFRYFDLNRLGFLRGEDLECIFMTLGLGITGNIAVELAAASDISLPHHPFLTSGYDPHKTLKYKPVCDWLKSVGLSLPSA
jgi:hypothetical protein